MFTCIREHEPKPWMNEGAIANSKFLLDMTGKVFNDLINTKMTNFSKNLRMHSPS